MGNLDSLRDWGHARDYVEMQWRMLQQEGPPEDFVIATGRQESVRRFIELTALELGWGALEHWQPGPEDLQQLNVGTGLDLTIRELAEAVAAATGYQGEIRWDASQPYGTPKKQLDVSRLSELGWQARIPLNQGLTNTVAAYKAEVVTGIKGGRHLNKT